jgi:hypothetical protein
MKTIIGAAIAALAVSAGAAVTGVVDAGGGVLEFHDTAPAWCMPGAPNEARRVDFIAANGDATRGCYIVTPDEMILFVLEDGRAGSGPRTALKPPKQA